MANSQNLTSPHIAATRVHSYLPILKTDCFTQSSSFEHQPASTLPQSWAGHSKHLLATSQLGCKCGASTADRDLRKSAPSPCRRLGYAPWKRSDLGREIFLEIERKREKEKREKGVEYCPGRILGIGISSLYPLAISRLHPNLDPNAAPRHAGKRIGTSEVRRLLLTTV